MTGPNNIDVSSNANSIFEQLKNYAKIIEYDASVFDDPEYKKTSMQFIENVLRNEHMRGFNEFGKTLS